MIEAVKSKLKVFNYIKFDEESHVYTNTKGLFPVDFGISSTGWVHKFVNPFDSEKWSNKKAKELGISQQEVLKMWDDNAKEASNNGTIVHKFIEDKLLKNKNNSKISEKIEKMINSFISRFYKTYSVVGCEIKVGSPIIDIAGMIDNLSYNFKSNKLNILDWKTSKVIKKENKYQKMLKPFDYLDDCNFNHYSLQLSLYKIILKIEANISIDDLIIVQFSELNDKFEMYKCLDLSEQISRFLKISM